MSLRSATFLKHTSSTNKWLHHLPANNCGSSILKKMDKVDEAMRVRCNLSIILSPSYAKTEINDQKLVLFQIKVNFLFLSQLWFLALQLVAMKTEGSLIRVELIGWFSCVKIDAGEENMLAECVCWLWQRHGRYIINLSWSTLGLRTLASCSGVESQSWDQPGGINNLIQSYNLFFTTLTNIIINQWLIVHCTSTMLTFLSCYLVSEPHDFRLEDKISISLMGSMPSKQTLSIFPFV